jgi:hypothetical protein
MPSRTDTPRESSVVVVARMRARSWRVQEVRARPAHRSAGQYDERVITYEESAPPRLAVASARWRYNDAEAWVRANREPMMLPDLDGCYMLVRIGAEGSLVTITPGEIGFVKNTQLAATKFRKLLSNR